MAVAQRNRFQATPDELAESRVKPLANSPAKSDGALPIGYVTFALAMLTAIYFGSMSPGTSPADFAAMSVFP